MLQNWYASKLDVDPDLVWVQNCLRVQNGYGSRIGMIQNWYGSFPVWVSRVSLGPSWVGSKAALGALRDGVRRFVGSKPDIGLKMVWISCWDGANANLS